TRHRLLPTGPPSGAFHRMRRCPSPISPGRRMTRPYTPWLGTDEGTTTVASNLTRDEAHDRARLIDVRAYRVDLDLTGDDKVFKSLTTVTFGCSLPGGGTFIDLAAESVTEIVLNGEPVALASYAGDRI